MSNLVIEHLKALRFEVSGLRTDLQENTTRLGRLEIAAVSHRRDMAHGEEASAEHGVRVDRLNARIERIERRLDITGDA